MSRLMAEVLSEARSRFAKHDIMDIMKELIHITHPQSTSCKEMANIINKLIKENPEIKYSKINSETDVKMYTYYTKKYGLPAIFPIFIGLVDGAMQDGHVGIASQLILKSLVN